MGIWSVIKQWQVQKKCLIYIVHFSKIMDVGHYYLPKAKPTADWPGHQGSISQQAANINYGGAAGRDWSGEISGGMANIIKQVF